MDRAAACRIVDINLNRLLEALRVVEDGLRVGGRPELFGGLKDLRQEAGGVRGKWNAEIWARDAAGDPGLDPGATTASEIRRGEIQAVLEANLSRAKEALRSIEEYSKVAEPSGETAAWAKSARRVLYDAEGAILTARRRDWLRSMRLYVVTPDSGGPALLEMVKEALEGGADVIQLRRKNCTDAELLADARALRELTRSAGVPLIVDDRPDIALMVGADGVHVGQDDLPLAEVRALTGEGMAIGVSTHSMELALEACRGGADYIGIGPVYSAATKGTDDPPLGPAEACRIAAAVTIPSVAIGGIGPDGARELREGGMKTIAVISAVMGAEDIGGAAADLKREMMRDADEGVQGRAADA